MEMPECTVRSIDNRPLKGVVLPRCRICDQVPSLGIKGGIWVKKVFICLDCEKEIINLDTSSSRYQILLQKIRQILR